MFTYRNLAHTFFFFLYDITVYIYRLHSYNKVYISYGTILTTHTLNNDSCLDKDDVPISRWISPAAAVLQEKYSKLIYNSRVCRDWWCNMNIFIYLNVPLCLLYILSCGCLLYCCCCNCSFLQWHQICMVTFNVPSTVVNC